MAKNDMMTYGLIILVIAVAAGVWLLYGKGLREGSPLGDIINQSEAQSCPDGNPECIRQLRGLA